MKFDCYKCGGSGQTSFHHIENGVCFTCGGSGELAYLPKAEKAKHVHPVIPLDERATDKQWSYLEKLTKGNDSQFCKLVRAAGAPAANQLYVTRKAMSKAIEMAKGGAA